MKTQTKTQQTKTNHARGCTCEFGHTSQRSQFPVGAEVETIADLTGYKGRTLERYIIPPGTKGVVQGHCDDGRASIDFGTHGLHTFHFADDYLRVTGKPEPLMLTTEDLQELVRHVNSAISLLSHGRIGLVNDPRSSSAPFDVIINGKWGIKKLKP